MSEEKPVQRNIQEIMPGGEDVLLELATAKSMDNPFGKDGIFARLVAFDIHQRAAFAVYQIRIR